ncbi:uncharacterized protein LOC111003756 [Pieris rapae]|uniref:uncharacterized protein LOC111003756 n=1 Tax=Pieris rapae TaxID=64459 RepID=UPI001E27C123|nr:uncharacterized protein LOC111003756 [Pieris rapae]
MPRYESDIWKHYKLLNLTGKKKHTACRYCDREYKNSNPTRCATHLVQCDNCPEDIRETLKGQLPMSVRAKIFHPNYKQFVHRKEVRQNIKTRHMVWEHFKSIKKPGMKKHAICIYCNFEVLEISILRLLDHIKRCEKIPEEIKKKFIELDLERYLPNNSYDPRIVIKKTFARPKVWEHYNILEQTGYRRHASCKYCGVEYRSSNATRLVVHLCRCVNCPENVKEKFMYGYHMNIDPPKSETSKKLCNRPAVNPHLSRQNRAATAGKPASDIWQYFSIISEVGYKKHGSCIYCSKEYKHCNATRLLKHIVVECDECPADVKKNYLADVSDSESSEDEDIHTPPPEPNMLVTTVKVEVHSEHEDEVMATSCATNSGIDPLENIGTTYEKSVRKPQTIDTDNDKIDRALARAIFASDVPHDILESKYWKKAIHLLRPNYNIPSVNDINRLFDDDCTRLNNEIDIEIANASTVSITYFIEEINVKEYLLCYVVMTPKPVCYEIKLMKTAKGPKDLQNLEETTSIINKIGFEKVVTFIYEKPYYKENWNFFPNILLTQCLYNTLYCWFENLIRGSSHIISTHDLKIHIKFLKESILPVLDSPEDDVFIKLINSLKIPDEAWNWKEYYNSFKLFLDNKDSITTLAVRFKQLDYYRSLSISEQSWNYHLRITETLEAVHDALEEARSEKTIISDVPAIFAQLMVNLEKDTQYDYIKLSLKQCKENYVKPIHLAANLLDPRYVGCSLSDKEIGDAMSFLSDFATKHSDSSGVVMKNVAEFKTRTGFFGKIDAVWNSVHLVEPRVWWQSFCSHLKVTPVAVRLLGTPCSVPEHYKINIPEWANEQDKERRIKLEKSRLNYYFRSKERTDETQGMD